MFCLSGIGSTISSNIFPAVDLSEGEWQIGLVDFTTYNSIPNVEQGVNNIFYFGEPYTLDTPGGSYKVSPAIDIPTGSYEIDDITRLIEEKVDDPENLKIRGNNNTFKVEIFTRHKKIDFTKQANIGSLLGFSPRVLEANKWHESDRPVDIIKVNVVRIECNVVRGSFQNGLEGHIIHEFYPTVPPGFKIVETPRNVIYLPVSVKRLENITVYFRDQNNRLINFRDETVNVRLHLKRK